MPNQNKLGSLVEDEFVLNLNNKRVRNLTNNLKTLIRDVFGAVSDFSKIKCSRMEDFIKPDIVITIGKVSKYISIKSGRSTNLHGEQIDTVIEFLANEGMPLRHLQLLRYYQYGDGTLNGTGKDRRNYHETFDWLEKYIKEFNEYIERHKEIVIAVVSRIVFDGVDPDAPKADYVYWGDINYGVAVSRNQIMNHLRRKNWAFYDNIHFGPLLIRPHAKYAHREIVNEKSRHKMDFYWANFSEDMLYIYKRYN